MNKRRNKRIDHSDDILTLILNQQSNQTLPQSRSQIADVKMPPTRASIKCTQCKSTDSLMWRQITDNQQICNDCYEKNRNHLKDELEPTTSTGVTISAPTTATKTDDKKSKLRKSTRSTRYKARGGGGAGAQTSGTTMTQPKPNKGGARGRRTMFRRAPVKAPTTCATTTFVKSLFFKVSINTARTVPETQRFS